MSNGVIGQRFCFRLFKIKWSRAAGWPDQVWMMSIIWSLCWVTSAKSCQHVETQLLCSRPGQILQQHSQMIVIQLISFIRSQFPWLPFVKPLNARVGTNKYTSNFSNQITMVVIFSWQKVKTKVYKWPECRRVYCSTLLHLQLVDDKPIQFLALFEN